MRCFYWWVRLLYHLSSLSTASGAALSPLGLLLPSLGDCTAAEAPLFSVGSNADAGVCAGSTATESAVVGDFALRFSIARVTRRSSMSLAIEPDAHLAFIVLS